MENNIQPNQNSSQLPYSIRLCFQLLLVILIIFIIIQGHAIFVPLYISVLVSILLLPIANFLERIHFPRSLAALASVLFAFLVIVTIIYLFSAQIIGFLNDIPAIKIHLTEHYKSVQQLLEKQLNISLTRQATLVNSATESVHSTGILFAKQTFFTVTQSLGFILFNIIYSFLILYYRSTIKKFLLALFKSANKKSVEDVLSSAKQVLKSYMNGLLIEMAIVSSSNSILLLIIGIKYAIFLGIFTGLLNILPFIGIYTGIIFTILISLTTGASIAQIASMVLGLLVIHLIDANFLIPKIVGAKLKINALMTIIGAIAGGYLMGISGVFLALPTIAILKILFDRIEGMEAWAILLGDETTLSSKKLVQRINKKLIAKKNNNQP